MRDTKSNQRHIYPSPYPNTLFHFTGFEGLKGIIKDRAFKLRYSTEKIGKRPNLLILHIPMVSFCDLRMSELPYHMSKYQEFGLGLSKEWGLNAGLNPVHYINQHSNIHEKLRSLLDNLETYVMQDRDIYPISDELSDKEKKHKERLNLIYNDSHQAWLFMKNYQDTLVRNGDTFNNFRFADEKEWRYALSSSENDVVRFYEGDGYKNSDLNEEQDKKGNTKSLKFSIMDIKYIIVPNDDYMRKFTQFLIHELKYDSDLITKLMSLLITAEQIKEDI